MSLIREIRLRARKSLPQVLAASFVVYIAYHTLQGERGLNTWVQLNAELAKAEALQQGLTAERRELETRVAHLRRESLDRDLLEERARIVLNLGRPDEYVINLPAAERP
ncbi:MAG TPA: septum formation initiator family protein [Kiloniellaceae bacterium]|nr:septum formation initiator family protein [Kiloniellaceae bacterium]